MTYDATLRGGYWSSMSDDDRHELDRLERKQAPSDFDRGHLKALSLRSNMTAEDARRVDALRARWEAR